MRGDRCTGCWFVARYLIGRQRVVIESRVGASVAWKKNKSRTFFGHSYTAPTPREVFLQQFGLHTTKALTVLLQNSFRNIVRDQADRRTADPPPPQADPRPTQFTFSDAPMMG